MTSSANLLDNGGPEVTGAPGRPVVPANAANPTCFIDRWWGHRGGDLGYAIGNLGGDGFPNCIVVMRNAGDASGAPLVIGQSTGLAASGLSTFDVVSRALNRSVAGLEADTLVFSVHVRTGANFSGSGVTLEIVSAATNVNICTGAWTIEASASFPSAQLSTSHWTRLQVTRGAGLWLNSFASVLGVRVRFDAPSGVAGAEDALYLTGAKLELSPTGAATTYVMPTMDEALRRCQRFYQAFAGAAAPLSASGYAAAGSIDQRSHLFAVQMIRAPAPSKSGAWLVSNCSQPTIVSTTSKGFAIATTAMATGAFSYALDSADDMLVFDAEV
jgi:hypothetical protein